MRTWKYVLGIAGLMAMVGVILVFRDHAYPTSLPELSSIWPLRTPVPTETPLSSGSDEYAVVSRVVDGDTVELSDGRKVRYIGINTPETVDPRKPVECFGQEAKATNSALVDGKTVRLEKDVSDTDRYGRLLRYVYVNGSMLNETLVREGYAYADTYPPDVRYSERFRAAESEARDAGKGFWSACPQAH